jgi:hypothetical protein
MSGGTVAGISTWIRISPAGAWRAITSANSRRRTNLLSILPNGLEFARELRYFAAGEDQNIEVAVIAP